MKKITILTIFLFGFLLGFGQDAKYINKPYYNFGYINNIAVMQYDYKYTNTTSLEQTFEHNIYISDDKILDNNDECIVSRVEFITSNDTILFGGEVFVEGKIINYLIYELKYPDSIINCDQRVYYVNIDFSNLDFYLEPYKIEGNLYKTFVLFGNYYHQPQYDDVIFKTIIKYYLTNDSTILTNLVKIDTIQSFMHKSTWERSLTEYELNNLDYNYLVLTVQNAFIDDNDLSNNILVYKLNLTDINNLEKSIIYPNPTSNWLYLKNINKIEIYSLNGQLINTYENKISINLSNFDNGMYIIRYYNRKENLIKTEKILKIN